MVRKLRHSLPRHIPPGNLTHAEMAKRFDNPRGYIGLSGIETGNKPLWERGSRHETEHAMEMGTDLARVGAPVSTYSGSEFARSTTKPRSKD